MPMQPDDRNLAVLCIRLETLRAAIESRSWAEVEFQYDRVLSVSQKMAGTRTRPVDAVRES
jgi:hypothetical protein